jgi:predicted 2-oxoglutarate/Fe(II)-dependent dioxygenase YbiX
VTGFVVENGLLRQRRFLDRDECARLRGAMDRGIDDPAEIVGREIATHDRVRRTRSVEIEAAVQDWFEARLDAIRTDLEAGLGIPLGSREGTGFLRYPAGGFYRTHRDRGEVAGWPDAARRAVSVVVFLNGARTPAELGDFEGGQLVLYPGGPTSSIEVVPEMGLLVAFPSTSLHEVLPVRAGIRDAAADWFYDR